METPQATLPPTSAPQPAGTIAPRLLDAGRGAKWWGEGWRVFTAAPGTWIGILIIFVILICVMAFIPILGQIALPLLMPVFSGGILLGCHALAKGQPLTIGHLFDGFKNGRAGPLIVLGLLSLVFNIVIWIVLAAVVVAVAGTSVLGMMSGDMSGAPPNFAAMGIGLALIIPLTVILFGMLLMLIWYAPPLVAINGLKPWAAMKSSFTACWSNMGALLIYGLIYIGLSIVATIPFGLGWLVLIPVLWGSWYAGWREMFGE
jgi:uncharacterized membrane protein